jgi:hypothetical protein
MGDFPKHVLWRITRQDGHRRSLGLCIDTEHKFGKIKLMAASSPRIRSSSLIQSYRQLGPQQHQHGG